MARKFYSTHALVCTVPYEHSRSMIHICDENHLSNTKKVISNKLFEKYGIHINWSSFLTKNKGQLCWYKSEVHLWDEDKTAAGEDMHVLLFARPLWEYAKKSSDLTLEDEPDVLYGRTVMINGDLQVNKSGQGLVFTQNKG